MSVSMRHEIRNIFGNLKAVQVRRQYPDGDKKVHWESPGGELGLDGVRVSDLPLYGSERIPGKPLLQEIIVVEGPKAADALTKAGFTVLGTVTGAAGCPGLEALDAAWGHPVILWPDADDTGVRHMRRVGAALAGVATSVRVFEWSEAPEGGDAFDYLDHDPAAVDRLRGELTDAIAFDEWSDGTSESECSENDQTEENGLNTSSQATRLAALAETAEFYHTAQGEAFATVEVSGHRENLGLRSRRFQHWLRHLWYRKYDSAPSAKAMTDAIATLEARAVYDGPVRPVFTRIGEQEGAVYLDLANEAWEVVEITAGGWRVLSDAPVRFRRPKGMQAIERPEPGGSESLLWRFLNLGEDRDRILVSAWVSASLRPRGPYPILIANGEQGSAKSTFCRVLRALIDPNAAPLRSEPREPRDLMIAATNGWMQAFDNLSHLPPWLSDALCRLATGGGFTTRELYTNDEEAMFDAQRPVLLNGITDLATRSDLLDRAIILTLPTIAKANRCDEETFWREFEAVRGKILGVLLDALAVGLREIHGIRLSSLPRMADFARWGAAVSPAFGRSAQTFLEAYEGNTETTHEAALEGSPVGAPLLDFMSELPSWTGTATQLLEKLEELVPENRRRRVGWPGNARALGGALRRIAPNLRSVGIEIAFDRDGRSRTISLTKKGENCVTSVTGVTHGQDAAKPGENMEPRLAS